jgi:hypothetical protein
MSTMTRQAETGLGMHAWHHLVKHVSLATGGRPTTHEYILDVVHAYMGRCWPELNDLCIYACMEWLVDGGHITWHDMNA